jgi:hypothetical protein
MRLEDVVVYKSKCEEHIRSSEKRERKKKEDRNAPGGMKYNEPDGGFLVQVEAKKLHDSAITRSDAEKGRVQLPGAQVCCIIAPRGTV